VNDATVTLPLSFQTALLARILPSVIGSIGSLRRLAAHPTDCRSGVLPSGKARAEADHAKKKPRAGGAKVALVTSSKDNAANTTPLAFSDGGFSGVRLGLRWAGVEFRFLRVAYHVPPPI
jgi:hypothetical protein